MVVSEQNVNSSPKPIRIYVVDDHAVVTRGLRSAIQVEPDFEWVGAQSSADGLIEAFDANRPDVVLLDIDMPGADAFVELSDLTELRPEARVMMLTSAVRAGYVDSAIRSGARGYIDKAAEFDAIFGSARRVAAGDFAFPDDVLARCQVVDGRLCLKDGGTSPLATLTPRESQVLRLIAQGNSTKEIADQIHRSVKRVEAIRTSVMRKLGCADRLELMRLAIREGIVSA